MNVWHYEQRIMIIKNDYADLKENRTCRSKKGTKNRWDK